MRLEWNCNFSPMMISPLFVLKCSAYCSTKQSNKGLNVLKKNIRLAMLRGTHSQMHTHIKCESCAKQQLVVGDAFAWIIVWWTYQQLMSSFTYYNTTFQSKASSFNVQVCSFCLWYAHYLEKLDVLFIWTVCENYNLILFCSIIVCCAHTRQWLCVVENVHYWQKNDLTSTFYSAQPPQ